MICESHEDLFYATVSDLPRRVSNAIQNATTITFSHPSFTRLHLANDDPPSLQLPPNPMVGLKLRPAGECLRLQEVARHREVRPAECLERMPFSCRSANSMILALYPSTLSFTRFQRTQLSLTRARKTRPPCCRAGGALFLSAYASARSPSGTRRRGQGTPRPPAAQRSSGCVTCGSPARDRSAGHGSSHRTPPRYLAGC